MKQRGFLLLEMMISLAILTSITFFIALIQANISNWHREAAQYLTATTLAQKILAQAIQKLPLEIAPDGFEISVSRHSFLPIPFTLYSVIIAFTTPRGKRTKVTLIGGM